MDVAEPRIDPADLGRGAQPALGRSLRARHVTMITIGGIIGAGLFVGSSTSIASIGPACIVSYGVAGLVILLVMRMLSELAASHPGVGAFTEFARLGLGEWAGFTSGWLYWYFWVMVVPIEALAGGGNPGAVDRSAGLGARVGVAGDHDGHQPDVHTLLRRIRVLVLLGEGGGDHRLHRHRRRLRVRGSAMRGRLAWATWSVMVASRRSGLSRSWPA